MAVALFLLSRLDETTPTAVMGLDFLVLGFGLGLILQVLVIAAQNTADYADLGAATSGVTFFRSIGGSFGVSIFGTIFTNQLASNLASRLHGRRLPPGFNPAAGAGQPEAAHGLPAAVRDDVLHAYRSRCTRCSSTAVPIALVAFVLTWFLREVPLRTAAGGGSAPPPARPTSARAWAPRRPSGPRNRRPNGRSSGCPAPSCGAAAITSSPARPASTCPAAGAGCSPSSPGRARRMARSWPSRRA